MLILNVNYYIIESYYIIITLLKLISDLLTLSTLFKYVIN